MKSKDKKIIVGTNHAGYPIKRNIENDYYDNVEIIQEYDIYRIFTHLYFKLRKKTHTTSLNSFNDFGIGKSKINHFFNGISFSNKPWFTTFETSLPRLGSVSKKKVLKYVKRLAHPSCKALFALSDNAKQIQKEFLDNNYADFTSVIMQKVTVLHPPQKMLINDYSEKKLENENIAFTITGGDFFRKGGLEILKVFSEFISNGFSLKLNIISNLQYGDYASHTTKKDLEEALNIIENNKQQIIHYQQIPNSKVLEIYKQTHVGLLPSYADTYGYSILEAQAAACPVITTNIRAFPEINNNNVGWLINVPKEKTGNGILKTKEDRLLFSKTIKDNLQTIIEDIINNPSQIKNKGILALDKIKKEHNPQSHAQKLEQIYNQNI